MAVDHKKVTRFGRLFEANVCEYKDELDERHERCYQMLTAIFADKSPKEANDALNNAVSKDLKTYEDFCIGFVVAILTVGPPGTDEANELSSRYFRDLQLVSRDGLQVVCGMVNHLCLEKYLKLLWPVKQQLVWLIKEMVHVQVAGVDQICCNIMRQIAGGDTSHANLWLTDNLMDIFIKYRTWVDKFPVLIATIVYTYLRVLEDYVGDHFLAIRNKVADFVVGLFRERFSEVLMVGRDLLRVLMYIARIPQIELLWKDMLYRPRTLSPTFKGIIQLMQTRTSRRFHIARITPDMERKVVFLTSQVRFGNHKRYQEWFQLKFLSTPESHSLRCDLIRFIVGVIHPSNEVLGSDIVPRWALIGWLLTSCTTQVATALAKLSLFYDWLYFDQSRDNIMNIEPGVLVMHYSTKSHPAITATLLDFLCRILPNFAVTEVDKVRAGLHNSFKTILEKRVLPSLVPLFENPRLDDELRLLIKDRFGPFVIKDGSIDGLMPALGDPMVQELDEDGPTFSDEEEDVKKDSSRYHSDEDSSSLNTTTSQETDGQKEKKTKRMEKYKNRSASQTSRNSVSGEEGEVLDDDIKEILQSLRQQEEGESRCEIMEQLVKHITSEEFSYDQCGPVASQLSEILQQQFEGKIFPSEPTPESIEDSIGKPLFVAFRALIEMGDSDPHRGQLLQLLAELYALQPRVGYYLLYFMNADRQVRREHRAKVNIYRDLCEKIDPKYSLDICLVNDMRQCQEDDVDLFVYLVPEVYTNFPKASIGNVDLLYLLVSCVDSKQICSLVFHVMSKDFIIVKKDCYQEVLSASLNWETFEQLFLWQLLRAHDLPIDCVLPLIPMFSPSRHHEALSAVSLQLKQEKPSADLIKQLFAREAHPNDNFVSAIITHWMHEYEERLGDLISSYLSKQASGGSNKRKRLQQTPTQKGSTGPQSLPRQAELVLSHLDFLRQTCKTYEFFNQRSIQSALQQVRHICTESQKKKFMDLFALADSDSEDESLLQQKSLTKGRNSGSGSGGGGSHSKGNLKSPAKSKSSKNSGFQQSGKISESSTESSGDSEDDKPVSRGRGQGRGGSKQLGAKSRKRAANRISYKEDLSSDASSDEDESLAKKKKRKKVSNSDSE